MNQVQENIYELKQHVLPQQKVIYPYLKEFSQWFPHPYNIIIDFLFYCLSSHFILPHNFSIICNYASNLIVKFAFNICNDFIQILKFGTQHFIVAPVGYTSTIYDFPSTGIHEATIGSWRILLHLPITTVSSFTFTFTFTESSISQNAESKI